MSRTYTVKAIWDAQASVWVSESDIDGLHIETATLDEFEDVLNDIGAELIAANHTTDADLGKFSARELIPAIVFIKPEQEAA